MPYFKQRQPRVVKGYRYKPLFSFSCRNRRQRTNPKAAVSYSFLLATILITSCIIIAASHKKPWKPAVIAAAATSIAAPAAQNDKNNSVPPTTIASATNSSNTDTTDVAGTSPTDITQTFTIKKRDRLARLFSRLQLNSKDAQTISRLAAAKPLRNLKSGKKITFVLAADHQLKQISYPISDMDTVIVKRTAANTFTAATNHVEPTVQLEYAAFPVHGSIYQAAKNTGITGKSIAQFINIFRDKVNPAKILHAGDVVGILYKNYYLHGRKLTGGNIVAAEFTHKDHTYKAVAFADNHGTVNYYTPDGHALKSAFIRYPLKFKYISSPFSLHRYQPILHIYRPHTGVDLAAHIGTPIKATSDGIANFVGPEEGYGKLVTIKHNQYTTYYAHLEKFAPGIHRGSFVHQGQLIGYVGSSGLSTGSHLHYEFRINNVPYDPTRVKLPTDEMIAKGERSKFFSQTRTLLAQLDLYMHHKAMVAVNDSNHSNSADNTKSS